MFEVTLTVHLRVYCMTEPLDSLLGGWHGWLAFILYFFKKEEKKKEKQSWY